MARSSRLCNVLNNAKHHLIAAVTVASFTLAAPLAAQNKSGSTGEEVVLGLSKDRVAITGAARDTITKQFDLAQQEAVQQTQKNFDLIFGENGPQFLKDRISNVASKLVEKRHYLKVCEPTVVDDYI